MYIKKLFLFVLFICIFHSNKAEEKIKRDSIIITEIWGKAPHNAFPDLLKFRDYFYCAFREATNHVGNENNGKVRIIRSKNGKKWESIALFDMDEDVREARLSITPSGSLMATVAAGHFKDGKYHTLAPYVSFSDKSGSKFSQLEKATFGKGITPTLDWIWRLTWHKNVGYGIMYTVAYSTTETGKNVRTMSAQLVSTRDGKQYQKVSKVDIDGSPNESTIRFDQNDRMYVLMRRETKDKMGVLAVSDFPYEKWTYSKLDVRLGGPNFLFLNDKQLVIGSRSYKKEGYSTALYLTDLKGEITKTIKLPSSGDNSYPGLVMDNNKLWVTYYSSHKGKAVIYLAQVPLSYFK